MKKFRVLSLRVNSLHSIPIQKENLPLTMSVFKVEKVYTLRNLLHSKFRVNTASHPISRENIWCARCPPHRRWWGSHGSTTLFHVEPTIHTVERVPGALHPEHQIFSPIIIQEKKSSFNNVLSRWEFKACLVEKMKCPHSQFLEFPKSHCLRIFILTNYFLF